MDILKYLTTFGTNPKENSRHLTSFIILVLLFGYAYSFFDVLILKNAIASNAIILCIFFLIKSLIADYDPLYSGDPEKNKYTKAFQSNLPTEYIMTTYDVEMREAKSLWYNVFNKWEEKGHEMHYNWKTTLRRGFKCRMVHFVIKSFRIMFFLALLSIGIIVFVNKLKVNFEIEAIDKYFRDHVDLGIPIFYAIMCILISIIFQIVNNPNERQPKGCYLRFNEINLLNVDCLRQNINSKEDFNNYGKKKDNNT